jgi:hypothetical protein
MGDFRLMAVQAALNKMVTQGYFDITTIDNIAKLMDLVPDRKQYTELRLLHCVHYDQMPAEMIEMLPEKIMAILRSPILEASRINLVAATNGRALRVICNG